MTGTTPVEADTLSPQEAPQSHLLHGFCVYPGTAFGVCQLLSAGDLDIPQRTLEKHELRSEIARLKRAFFRVNKELTALSSSIEEEVPPEAHKFIEVSLIILQAPTLLELTIAIIKDKLINAEWALSLRLDQIKRDFDVIEDDYIRERFSDIAHVVSRLQRSLVGAQNTKKILGEDYEEKIILVSDDLDPADILQIRLRDDLDITGLVLEEGSVSSHTSILASSLEIPTLVGVKNAREFLENGQPVLLESHLGQLNPEPTSEECRQARSRMRETLETRRELKKFKDRDAITLDGVPITLLSNIALPEDTRDIHRFGAQGVGLFRTEFLYLNRDQLPDEEEQYQAYCRVMRSMKGKTVTLRTADLGGDKLLSPEVLHALTERDMNEWNPSLGLRGIRFSLAFPELFKTQIRAILRASSLGHINILLPFITLPKEVENVKQLIEEAKEELQTRGVKYSEDITLGAMLEVPGTIMMLDELQRHLDFFSIGTNDLIQYTLAADRTNAEIAQYYDEYHPGVLKLIAQCINKLRKAKKNFSVCGEMAGHPHLINFFIGLGCTQLSMTCSQIPKIKSIIFNLDTEQAQIFARRALKKRTAKSLRDLFAQQEFLTESKRQ